MLIRADAELNKIINENLMHNIHLEFSDYGRNRKYGEGVKSINLYVVFNNTSYITVSADIRLDGVLYQYGENIFKYILDKYAIDCMNEFQKMEGYESHYMNMIDSIIDFMQKAKDKDLIFNNEVLDLVEWISAFVINADKLSKISNVIVSNVVWHKDNIGRLGAIVPDEEVAYTVIGVDYD